jgi:dihydroxyacetone kinase-like predicted kinase
MKEFIQKYQKAITGTGAIAVLVICYFQQKELSKLRAEQKIEVVVGGDIQKAKTMDSLMNVIDSIRAENLPLEVENARYYMALELLREEDKKAADLFQSILETQTE